QQAGDNGAAKALIDLPVIRLRRRPVQRRNAAGFCCCHGPPIWRHTVPGNYRAGISAPRCTVLAWKWASMDAMAQLRAALTLSGAAAVPCTETKVMWRMPMVLGAAVRLGDRMSGWRGGASAQVPPDGPATKVGRSRSVPIFPCRVGWKLRYTRTA